MGIKRYESNDAQGRPLRFSTVEIDNLIFSPIGDEEDTSDPDDEPVAIGAPGTAVSQTGDMWERGAHRVLCGSSLEAETLAMLMDGRTSRMGAHRPSL